MNSVKLYDEMLTYPSLQKNSYIHASCTVISRKIKINKSFYVLSVVCLTSFSAAKCYEVIIALFLVALKFCNSKRLKLKTHDVTNCWNPSRSGEQSPKLMKQIQLSLGYISFQLYLYGGRDPQPLDHTRGLFNRQYYFEITLGIR